jgi:hypothetical protein
MASKSQMMQFALTAQTLKLTLIPQALRPSVIIQRQVMARVILGTSRFWTFVAVLGLARNALRAVFGKQSETLGTRVIGVGSVITVAAAAPLSRRQAKRAGVSKTLVAANARADLEAAQRAS